MVIINHIHLKKLWDSLERNNMVQRGLHSSDNIVIACLQCNCTKRDMTEQEFNNYKLQINE